MVPLNTVDTDGLKALVANAEHAKVEHVSITTEALTTLLQMNEHLDSELSEMAVLADARGEEIDALKDVLRDLEDENQRLADACEGIEHAGRQ